MKPKKKLSRDTSFVIIGAGVAGLTAARQLLDEGYRKITIIEAAATAGGKCRTVELAGKPFDMGAIVGSARMYRELLARSAKHGLTTTVVTFKEMSLAKQGEMRALSSAKANPRLFWEGLKYFFLLLVRWRGLQQGEMARLPEETCHNLSEVSIRYQLQNFEQRARPLLTGMGYSFPDKLPVAYATNMLSIPTILGHAFKDDAFIWSTGTQKIWHCEAAELQTRGVRFHYNTRVQKVSRTNGIRIILETSEVVLNCDELIVACDPRLLRLDLTSAEQAVIAAIRNVDYRVLACRIEGLPPVKQPTAFCLSENMCPARSGHPMALFRIYPDDNIYLSYAFGAGSDEETIKSLLANDVKLLGGRVTEHLYYQEWRNYFPHFDAAALQAGILDDLQNLQGARHTTYIGEWATFAMMPRVMKQTQTVIQRLIQGHASPEAEQSSYAQEWESVIVLNK